MIRLAIVLTLSVACAVVAAPRDEILEAISRGDCSAAFAVLDAHGSELPDLERCTLEGRAEMCAQRWIAARTAFQKALKLDADNAETRFRLGQAHAALRSDLLAIEQFEKAAWLGMDTIDLNLDWARCALRSGRPRGETKVVDVPAGGQVGDVVTAGIVIRLGPRLGKAIVAERSSALYRARRALELDPQHVEAALLYGEAWRALGEWSMAADRFRHALTLVEPQQRAEVLDRLCDVLLELGEFDEYFVRLRERMQIGGGLERGKLAAAYEKAAQSVAERGELARQIRYLTFAVEIDATADRHIALADALALAGRGGDAVEHWQAALELSPTHSSRAVVEARIRQYQSGDNVTK